MFRIRSRCLPASRPISNGRYSGTPPEGPGTASLRGFNPLRPGHSSPSSTQPHLEPLRGSATPHLHHVTMMDSVCPPPLSFAITHGIAYCFLFLRLLRCFSSAGSPSPKKRGVTSPRTECRDGQEVPFGNPRIQGCMLLPWAYRSLPRPSSATQAKPSPRRHK